MEDHAGLLGKTMNSALYWLLHQIDTLQAIDNAQCTLLRVAPDYRVPHVLAIACWDKHVLVGPTSQRLSWQNLSRWAGQLYLGFSDLLPAT